MKKILRRVSLLLAAVLLLQTVPGVVRAEDEYPVLEGSFSYVPAFVTEPVIDTFYYSDGYFMESSLTDNTHRLTMSMVLAISTFEIRNDTYVTGLLEKAGFEDIETQDMTVRPSRNTIGTAIAHKSIGEAQLVAVAIRGAKYASEWASNLTGGAEGDAMGLSESADRVAERIKAYIGDHQLKKVKLWVVGYSRGGAVSGLTGVLINENPEEFSTTVEDTFVYTFEAPKASASQEVYRNIRCVRNQNDFITYFYPSEWGMYANGIEVLIGEPKDITLYTLDLSQFYKREKAQTMNQEEFLMDLTGFLAGQLPREVYADGFDEAAAGIADIFMGKDPEEKKKLVDYFLDVFEGKLFENRQLLEDILLDITLGILQHNSDRMYEKLAADICTLLDLLIDPQEDMGLTEEEFEVFKAAVYPVFRTIGPVLIIDGYSRLGAVGEASLPEGYNDPDYDPYEDPAFAEHRKQSPEAVRARMLAALSAMTGWIDGYFGFEKYTGYNDTPLRESSRSEEFLAAYRSFYAQAYEDAYLQGIKDAASGKGSGNETSQSEDARRGMPLYHILTIVGNARDLITEHEYRHNFELVKSLDSYYAQTE